MYALMCDNVIVAKYDSEKEVFRLEDGVPEFFIPRDLFRDGKKEVTLCEFYLWLEDRVFPPNRIGAKKLLKSLGLKSIML